MRGYLLHLRGTVRWTVAAPDSLASLGLLAVVSIVLWPGLGLASPFQHDVLAISAGVLSLGAPLLVGGLAREGGSSGRGEGRAVIPAPALPVGTLARALADLTLPLLALVVGRMIWWWLLPHQQLDFLFAETLALDLLRGTALVPLLLMGTLPWRTWVSRDGWPALVWSAYTGLWLSGGLGHPAGMLASTVLITAFLALTARWEPRPPRLTWLPRRRVRPWRPPLDPRTRLSRDLWRVYLWLAVPSVGLLLVLVESIWALGDRLREDDPVAVVLLLLVSTSLVVALFAPTLSVLLLVRPMGLPGGGTTTGLDWLARLPLSPTRALRLAWRRVLVGTLAGAYLFPAFIAIRSASEGPGPTVEGLAWLAIISVALSLSMAGLVTAALVTRDKLTWASVLGIVLVLGGLLLSLILAPWPTFLVCLGGMLVGGIAFPMIYLRRGLYDGA